MWRVYSIGFGLMSVVMVVVGATLFIVTLLDPGASGGATPEWVWLTRALVAIVMGVIAATLAIAAWRQAQRPQV